MKRFENRTVVITGSNRGLGLEILKQFASEGANIIACMRSEKEETKATLNAIAEENGISITPIYFDMADEAAVKAGCKEIKAMKVPVDVLVNNAGVPHLAILPFTKMQDVHDVFQVNYFSQLLITQSLCGLLRKSAHGAIVNMASIAGIDGEAGNAVYGATKASMILLTRVLSKELAGKVRVNAVAPGLTETDFAEKMGAKAKESMEQSSLMHRLGNPSEIAKTVAFLASDDASFINGQVIRVDGGVK